MCRRSMRINQLITSAVVRMTTGLSATATFATNHDCVASAEILSTAVLYLFARGRIEGHRQEPVLCFDLGGSSDQTALRMSAASPLRQRYHPDRAAMRIGPVCAGLRSALGATTGRADSKRWSNRAIVGGGSPAPERTQRPPRRPRRPSSRRHVVIRELW